MILKNYPNFPKKLKKEKSSSATDKIDFIRQENMQSHLHEPSESSKDIKMKQPLEKKYIVFLFELNIITFIISFQKLYFYNKLTYYYLLSVLLGIFPY